MPLEDVLAVIKGPSGKSRFGAGILVDSDLVLSCAHVVNLAIGRPMHESSRPREQLQVALHTSPSEELVASIDDAADAWTAPPASSGTGADLCLLRLTKPTTAAPAMLFPNDNLILREFRAAGYPQDWDGDLDIAIGEIVGKDAHGLFILRPPPSALAAYAVENNRLLRRDRRPTGVIHSGFSGGPVEVDGTIVGLVAEARNSLAEATAYMVPVSLFPQRLLIFPSGQESHRETEIEFVSQVMPGPMVKEKYLVTDELTQAYACNAKKQSDAVGILNKANRLRVESARRSKGQDKFALLDFIFLPNIDAGPNAFWSECFMHACLLGPRMLVSLLAAAPDGQFDAQAKQDKNVLLNFLLEHYRIQDDQRAITANQIERNP